MEKEKCFKVTYEDAWGNETTAHVYAKSIAHCEAMLRIGCRTRSGRTIQVYKDDIFGIQLVRDDENKKDLDARVKETLENKELDQIVGCYYHEINPDSDDGYYHYIVHNFADCTWEHFVQKKHYGHISHMLGLDDEEYTLDMAAGLFLDAEAMHDDEVIYDKEIIQLERD